MRTGTARFGIAMFVLVLACPLAVRAGAVDDLNAANAELGKASGQNAQLIDAKLASAVSKPQELGITNYVTARKLQEARAVAAMTNAREPAKRKAVNDGYIKIIAELKQQFLKDTEQNAARRLGVYGCQVDLANAITAQQEQEATLTAVASALLGELDRQYMAAKDLKDADKEAGVRLVMDIMSRIAVPALRDQFVTQVYERYVTLSTLPAMQARLTLASRRSATDSKAALNDLARLIDDPNAPAGLRAVAHRERMTYAVNRVLPAVAAADAKALLDLQIEGDYASYLSLEAVVDLKWQAIDVLKTGASITADAADEKRDALCLELLGAGKIGAEQKSQMTANFLLVRSRECGSLRQWDKALAWAKEAYAIAPNPLVGAAATQIQQILANRGLKPLDSKGFNVAPSAADIQVAHAFYVRQAGRKTVEVPASDRKGTPTTKEIVLLADLSNNAEFPRQLDRVEVAFGPAAVTALGRIAGSDPDMKARALASSLAGKYDQSINIMGQAILQLGMESSQLSDYVNFTARFVRAKFESVALANAFLESQVHGPEGEDGRLGTPDDKPNPLAASGR